MTVNRNIFIVCGAVGFALVGVAFVAGAQTGSAGRAIRVAAASSETPAPRTSAPEATAASAATAAAAGTGAEVISRETFNYLGSGRRDPFVSLMNTEDLRPLFQDLKLVAVAYDATGPNSVAVLRDVTSKMQYRVKVGQEIGRMRVASISQKSVLFGIEEFGYSRQETLAMTDSTKVRTQ